MSTTTAPIQLTERERQHATQAAQRFMHRYAGASVETMVTVLYVENVRLAKEINEYRAALGLDPLPTLEM